MQRRRRDARGFRRCRERSAFVPVHPGEIVMNPSAKAAGLRLGTCACRDRHHDGCPAADVARSVRIGVGNVSTAFADKLASAIVGLPYRSTRTRCRLARCRPHRRRRAISRQACPCTRGSREAVRKPICRADRCDLLSRLPVRCRMPLRSSRAIPRSVCLALLTMRLLSTWFVSRLKRRSLPDSFLRWRLADLVPAFCSLARMRS